MSQLKLNYIHTLNALKKTIRQARLRAALVVNAELLILYWEIGSTILDQQAQEGWGSKTIDRLAADLKIEFPDMEGLSVRNLKYMRAFAEAYPEFSIVQAPLAQLDKKRKGKKTITPQQKPVQAPLAQITWYHHITLLQKVKDQTERLFYIQKTIENGWSRNVMLQQIESNLYKRLGKAITNFKETLPTPDSDLAQETMKNPYVFEFLALTEEMKERELEKGLISHLKEFMLELGKGFSYVGNQKNVVVDGDDYFLDLLFYNYHLHCFVVFELKVGEFKPEYAGKLNFYVNTIDAQLKGKNDNPTIGVLLCKTPNETVVKYALQGINSPIGVAEYKLMPKALLKEMPSLKELETEIEKETKEISEPLREGLDKIKSLLADLNSDKVSKSRNQESILFVFDNVFFPLYNAIKSLLESSLGNYFERFEFPVHPNNGKNTLDSMRQNLHGNAHAQKLTLFVQLKGFKHAGTDVFSLENRVDIYLDEYKYTCSFSQNSNYKITKLYHQTLSNNELNEMANELCKTFLEETANKIEAIKKERGIN